MKNLRIHLHLLGLLTLVFLFPGCSQRSGEIPYGTGIWEADSLGNHRVVLNVADDADAVYAHIPWRRRDDNPQNKNIIITDNENNRIENIFRFEVNREYGDIVFKPENGVSEYYLYYLPYKQHGRSNYPTVTYPEPVSNADNNWLAENNLNSDNPDRSNLQSMPAAEVKEFQSIDEFNSFYPMEVIATGSEIEALLAQYPDRDYILFPEDRMNPIKMTNDLPYEWVKEGPQAVFKGEAKRGEFYAFQVGFYAVRGNVEDIEVEFSGLEGSDMIPADAFSSFNTEGINWDGREFDKVVPVNEGKVQALWMGVQVPEDAKPGKYSGKVTVKPAGKAPESIDIELKVSSDIIEDYGDNEPWNHSRLRWLNSRIAFDNHIVSPFVPMEVNDRTISCLGRELKIGDNGFPESIKSYFASELTHLVDNGRDLLASPVKLVVELNNGRRLNWQTSEMEVTGSETGVVTWMSRSSAGGITLELDAKMEFDGYVSYTIRVGAESQKNIKDIFLEIPLKKDAAKYMMGLGVKGGYRPRNIAWKWEVEKHQEGAWLGDVNAGMQFVLRDENYDRPLNTNFYLSKPLIMPGSWENGGRGGINIRETRGNRVLVRAYSGARIMEEGDVLYYNFNFLLTPFKPIDTKAQWSTRFYHRFNPLEEIAQTGANTVNVHHANRVNPYINYPFIATKEMKEYVDEAHSRDMNVKIYNTIRELSNRAYELFAFRSLGHELFSDGPGGGFSWLQEHIGSNYIAAWFVPPLKDAAIINSGMSRWHNYYVEGLDWLVKNMEIDGLYIDDVAFDRTTMKRVRKILNRGSGKAIIDLHSANQYNPRDGFINSSLLYLEHFPYINRLWFGEYFDYDSKPDFWLVELSGIPYGLMGEMLQDGGNRWRGMIYGMTARLPWAGDPTPLWQAWDEFGIDNSRMIGYWSENCPVTTGRDDVLATAYVRENETMVAIASWAENTIDLRLSIDWNSLGIEPGNAKITAPAIKDFQELREFSVGENIPVESGKGWLIIISNN
ncbi:MAG: hypothetical protein GY863_23020 [bacterium]|nr:hypothetical protein [bacterium]